MREGAYFLYLLSSLKLLTSLFMYITFFSTSPSYLKMKHTGFVHLSWFLSYLFSVQRHLFVGCRVQSAVFMMNISVTYVENNWKSQYSGTALFFSLPETGYAEVGFSWYFSISPDKFRDNILKRCTQTSFSAFYNLLLTAYSSIFLDSLQMKKNNYIK
jgi:hypothetical protein